MTFAEFARHILHMECGESLELYAAVNRQTRECSRPLSVRKEQWNGTPFYLLGGHGQEVRTINLRVARKRSFKRPAMMLWTATMPWKVSGRSCRDCVNYLPKSCISGLRKR